MALRGIIRFTAVLVLIGLIAAAATAMWLWRDYQQFLDAPLNLPEQIAYKVERGAVLGQVAADLKAQGVLAKPLYLRLLGRQRGDAGQIKAGEYALTPGLTPTSLLDLLVSGKVIEYGLTLIEGWTFAQVMAAVRADSILIRTLPENASAEAVMTALGHPGVHPEGRFFPDTYLFPRQTTDIQLLGRALDRMTEVLAEEWSARAPDLPLESADDALVLASIIEKETGLASERAEIAGVFVRRLRKGMLLQTDPTVIYGLGESFDGDLRRRDLKQDTPYNTYTRPGLTPTPICMPGRESIHAALHPAEGDALYFVATGDGGHYFSATLEEHNRAVRRYQIEKRR